MPKTTADDYAKRFRPVLQYIDHHLDDDLTVEQLSGVAACSKYHFHRQFSALFGVSLYKYVQLNRLKRAAYQLAFRQHQSIIAIALESGYENHESFSRAFKKSIGQTPSEFRKQPQWEDWHLIYQPLQNLRMTYMRPETPPEWVQIITFPSTLVAVLEHRGEPQRIGDSICQFIQWRKQHHLSPQGSATFNLLYNHPRETAPEDYRLDLCVAIDRRMAEKIMHPGYDNPLGITTKTIPGGRCAVLRHIGSDADLGDRIHALYAQWLPRSDENLRDFPLYLQRVSFFPDVPEASAITDIFLPLE